MPAKIGYFSFWMREQANHPPATLDNAFRMHPFIVGSARFSDYSAYKDLSYDARKWLLLMLAEELAWAGL